MFAQSDLALPNLSTNKRLRFTIPTVAIDMSIGIIATRSTKKRKATALAARHIGANIFFTTTTAILIIRKRQ